MTENELKKLVDEVEAELDDTRREHCYNMYRKRTFQEAMGGGSHHDLDPHLHAYVYELAQQTFLYRKILCKLIKMDEQKFEEIAATLYEFPEKLGEVELMEEGPQYAGD